MHSLILLTASTAFAAAIPFPASTDSSSPPCPSTTVTENLSSAFGWQLVGTTTSSARDQICTKLQDNQLLKWGNLGLDLTQISQTVCDATGSASDVLPKAVTATTQTITTLLANAFPEGDTETYGYLCDNLQNKRVAGFLLDDSTFINSTCQLAGRRTSNPSPFSVPASAEKNESAIAAYGDAQSKLYAYLYVAQAGSTSDLDSLCSAAGAKQTDYEALQLNSACVHDTICAVQEPISVEEGKEQLKKWTSTIFATVLLNSSGVAGYANTLCEKLDVSRLETVGIDGQSVKEAVCGA